MDTRLAQPADRLTVTGSPKAIVVDADVAELRRTAQALAEAGFAVTTASSLPQAKELLASMAPELVIADIKLGPFNGLHLAIYCAVSRPGTPFIATHDVYDAVLDEEAKRLTAAYVVKTVTREGLTRTAVTLLHSRRQGFDVVRRSYRKPAPIQTVAQVAASRAEVVDVSYGGVQLKLPSLPTEPSEEDEPPISFDIVFPDLDLSLHAARIWAHSDRVRGGWLCGTEFSWSDSTQIQRWRDFVDSVG
jgi:DNA-binding response OmpR family regulator